MSLKLRVRWFLLLWQVSFSSTYIATSITVKWICYQDSRSGGMQNGWIQPGKFASSAGSHVEIQGVTVSPLPLDTHLCIRLNIHWDFKRKYNSLSFLCIWFFFHFFSCTDHLPDSVKNLMNGKQGNRGKVRVSKRRYIREDKFWCTKILV